MTEYNYTEQRKDDQVSHMEAHRQNLKNKMETSRRSILVISLSVLVALAGLGNSLYTLLDVKQFSQAASIALIIISSGVAVFSYLNPNSATGSQDQAALEEQVLRRRMLKKASEIFDETLMNKVIVEGDKEQLLRRLEEKIQSDAFTAFYKEIQEDAIQKARHGLISQHFADVSLRLSREVYSQTRRGTLNLVLGFLMAFAGLVVLGLSVYWASGFDVKDILGYFLPRFCIGILIQIFAYFFLRLYKQSLSEIKYFQNELTNIEAIQLAILVARAHGDSSTYDRIVKSLIKTERNFLMEKNQTTIELERERIEGSNVTDLLKAVKAVVRPRE